MRLFFFLCLISLFTQFATAAPHPLMGSSFINRPQNALAFSQMGFLISGIPESWNYQNKIDSESPLIEIGPADKSVLSFRLENVPAQVKLESYVRKYLRDYNQYGFEVLQLQSKNNGLTVVVDLKQKNKSTKSRQVFFQNQGKIAVATCSDEPLQFNQTLEICNRILSQFRWK